MNITSLNCWGGKLHAPLIGYLSATQPDVVCLQEVVHTPETGKDWLTYRDGDHVLPQRARLFDELSAALPDHGATFCPAAQGVLWDGDRSVPSQWGLATFVRRDLPVIAQIQGFVHKDFSPDGYGDHPRSRGAHAIKVWDFGTGRPLTIAHFHGLRDLAGKADTPDRAEQARRLRSLVLSIWSAGERLVICGDFNVGPDSVTFDILGELGVRDLVTTGGFDGTRTSHYTKPGKFADYMLVNAAVDVARFDVVRTPEISDHCPLVLDTGTG